MCCKNEETIEVLLACGAEDWICRQFLDRCMQDESAARMIWHTSPPDEVSPEVLARVEIICGYLPENWHSQAKRLRWVQFLGAGIEGALTPELVDSDVIVTNASGVHAVPISEHILGMMMAFARGLHRCVRQQVAHEWNDDGFAEQVFELAGKTVGIIGLGDIGEAAAMRAKALGMRAVATRRHIERFSVHIDRLMPPEQLPELLQESDFVVICAPLTRETCAMIGEEQLRQMKPNAILINIARGAIVQQDVLIRALQEGWIAGAGLDVFEPEPLPPDSPLWDMPNVIISPHMAGLTPIYGVRAAEIFLENLRAYLRGAVQEMPTLVDKRLGY